MKKLSLLFFFSLFISFISWSQLSSFAHKYELLLTNNTGADLTNDQVLVLLPAQSWLNGGKINSNASDLRFSSDCDGTVLINYFVEDTNIVDDLFKVWLNVDLIPANGAKSVFVFTGDPIAASQSDFDLVFPFPEQLVISDTIDPADQAGLSDGTYSSIIIKDGGAIISSVPVDGENNIIINTKRLIIEGTLSADGAGYDGSIASADFGPGAGAADYGGGGASYAARGSNGGLGAPGALYAQAAVDTIQMGSAGGGGELSDLLAIGLPLSYGGSGGGAIELRADYVNVANTGVLSVNGIVGEDFTDPGVISISSNFTGSAAGGGSAGGILLSSHFLDGYGLVSALGGNGGNTPQNDGAGGGGAGGYLKIFATNIVNSFTIENEGGAGGSSATGTLMKADTGIVEINPSMLNNYSYSLSGELTSTVSLTNSIAGAVCPADTVIYSATTGFPNYEFFLDEGVGFVSAQNSSADVFEYLNPKDGAKIYVYAYTTGGCFAFSDTLLLNVDPQAIADFSFTQNDLEVTVINESIDFTSIKLDMGDGTIYTVGDTIIHSYTAVGTYAINLVAFNACLNDTIEKEVTVSCGTLTSNFNFTVSALTASFTQTGLGNSVSHLWDFGDGSTSTLKNPSHTYAANGIYDVSLSITNACGITETFNQPVDLNCDPPSPDFDFTILGYVATFTDLSAAGADYSWDFGDGNTSTDTNPTNDYMIEGSYTVTLTVTNPCGTQTIQKVVDVVCPKPIADFDFVLTAYTADFTNLSSVYDNSKWTFGDGNSSTLDNPSNTYAIEDDFNVKLVVSNICGADSVTKTVTVDCPLPVANFTYSSSENQFEFYNASTNFDSFVWDLVEGGMPTLDTVAFTYPSSGLRNVCIEATNSCGTKQYCEPVDVQCVVNTTILITNTPSGYVFVTLDSLNQYLWDFGDGTTSTDKSPVHKFPNSTDQSFTVCLNGINACGDPINVTCDTFFITNIGAKVKPIIELVVYPNPVQSVLTIDGYEGVYSIYNVAGKKVSNGYTTLSEAQYIGA